MSSVLLIQFEIYHTYTSIIYYVYSILIVNIVSASCVNKHGDKNQFILLIWDNSNLLRLIR